MEHFSATTYPETVSVTESRTRHDVFHSFLPDNKKQDATTTAKHRNHLIELLKQQKNLSSKLGTPWENTDGCVNNYICTTKL